MAADVNLNDVRMHVSSTDSAGVVGSDTILKFEQQGDLVSARYAGGKISLGFLVGTLHANRLEFRFAQVDRDGRVDGGHSTCDVERLPDGKIRIIEYFQWDSRPESGTNIFDELP